MSGQHRPWGYVPALPYEQLRNDPAIYVGAALRKQIELPPGTPIQVIPPGAASDFDPAGLTDWKDAYYRTRYGRAENESAPAPRPGHANKPQS